jgi:hypothetical protein
MTRRAYQQIDISEYQRMKEAGDTGILVDQERQRVGCGSVPRAPFLEASSAGHRSEGAGQKTKLVLYCGGFVGAGCNRPKDGTMNAISSTAGAPGTRPVCLSRNS